LGSHGIIIVADLIMSLDNVLAVAATAHGDLGLVIFGIGLSIHRSLRKYSPSASYGSLFSGLSGWRRRSGWWLREMAVTDTMILGWIGSWEMLVQWLCPVSSRSP